MPAPMTTKSQLQRATNALENCLTTLLRAPADEVTWYLDPARERRDMVDRLLEGRIRKTVPIWLLNRANRLVQIADKLIPIRAKGDRPAVSTIGELVPRAKLSEKRLTVNQFLSSTRIVD